MGPEFWKPDKATKLKKCSEFRSPSCDTTETHGCCAVIPCSYCLTWSVYGEADVKGVADFVADGWYGTIAEVAFRAYWERPYPSADSVSTTSFESTAGTEAERLSDSETELNATITTSGSPSIDDWFPRNFGGQNLRLFVPSTQWVEFTFTVTGTASFSFWYYMPAGPDIDILVDGVATAIAPVSTYTQHTITGLAAGSHTIRITRTHVFPTGNALDIDDVEITVAGNTSDCEFVVELGGTEIYRNDCYGGQSCRDSSDSAAAVIAYDDGILYWDKIEPRPLEYVADYETKCIRHFCGSCECSCDCLCVRITDPYGTITRGEICDISYPCDGPVWEGTVGDYDLSIALGRDVYGECVITPTVDGIELDQASAGGCGAMAAVIALDDGTTIAVRCKICDCDVDNTACCPDLSGWPASLTIEITDPDGCFNLTGVLPEISAISHTYGGTITGSCTSCGITSDFSMEVVLSCSANGGWILEFNFDTPADDCGALPPDTVLDQISCDPIYLSGDIYCFSCPSIVCPGVPNPPDPPLPYPHPPFCPSVIVYETA